MLPKPASLKESDKEGKAMRRATDKEKKA